MAGEARQITLGARLIDYTLHRRARRSLSMTIGQHGLTVSIPPRASLAETERFLRERSQWIIEKLDEWAARPAAASFTVEDGAQFSMLGQPCTLRLSRGRPQAVWVQPGPRMLHLQVRAQDAPVRALLRAVQQYALGYFGGRIEEYGWMLQQSVPGLALPPLSLSNARTRWGSCSQRSGIRLNWRLIHLPQAQIDYVVAHELAHLVEMNHSPRFWQIVELMYPEHHEARAALREAHTIIPAW